MPRTPGVQVFYFRHSRGLLSAPTGPPQLDCEQRWQHVLAGCLPTTVGFLLCQGEIVSINIIIYWELLGLPRVFLFFPVRTSTVKASHPCVILSLPPQSMLQKVVHGKLPESTQSGGSCVCRRLQRTGTARSVWDQEGRLGKHQLASAHPGEDHKTGCLPTRPAPL